MKRSRINPISKKKCRKDNPDCGEFCSKCSNPKIVYEHKVYKPMNQISKKKRQDIEEEKPIREALYKRADGKCEHCGEAPDFRGLHPHEKIFRGRGGKLTLGNSEIWCGYCHTVDGHNLKEVKH
jgi:hypothetical protein